MENEQSTYQLVTIEEMREMFSAEEEYGIPSHYELQKDEQTGLYTNDLFALGGNGILRDHYVMEQLLANAQQVDWRKVSNCYDASTIGYIEYVARNPLVWEKRLPDALHWKYVLSGRIASEKSIKNERQWWEFPLRENEDIKWFVENLPTPLYNGFYDQPWGVPSDMILWNYFISDREEEIKMYKRCTAYYRNNPDVRFEATTEEKEKIYLNTQALFNNLNYVVQTFGESKAVELIRQLQTDWKCMTSLKLFGANKVCKEHIEEFRLFLFEGLDRYINIWEHTETPLGSTPSLSTRFSLLTDTCRKEKKVDAVESEIRAACHGTAVGLWKILRTNAALKYIEPLEPWNATDLYRVISNYFGDLPFKERNFRDARNKK